METKTLKTPGGVEVVLKAWISGEEFENIRKPIIDIKMPLDDKNGEVNFGQPTKESVEIAVRTVVVSVDGKPDDTLKAVRALRKKDYLFVLNEVDKVVKGEDFLSPAGKPAVGTGSEK